jgi:hypothetical protein
MNRPSGDGKKEHPELEEAIEQAVSGNFDLRTPDGIQVEYSVDEILKLLRLPQEKKLSLARKHRECLEELRECTLLPEAAIDVETGE